MCIVSNIGDDFSRRWKPRIPGDWYPDTTPGIVPFPYTPPNTDPEDFKKKIEEILNPPKTISKEDFDQLKREVEALKDAIKFAKIYDEVTQQKDCEMEEKIAFLREVAKRVGVNLDDAFAPKQTKRNSKKVKK